MFNSFLVKTGLKWVGKKTNGYKTTIGAILFTAGQALAVLIYFAGLLWPDLQIQSLEPITSVEQALEQAGAVLMAIGLGHKAIK